MIFIIINVLMILNPTRVVAFYEDLPVTRDSRIKTYIYNKSEVFMLILHFGYQSHIEFAEGEVPQTISVGDSFAWKITPLENRLFIRPLEKNIKTNMTIITNKRTYQFDLVAKELEEGMEEDLVYQIRFFYPKKIGLANVQRY
ncbi:MAG: TrbG/VirB9 family P-type conjugative transfer protein [Rickettsiaceae bacterium]|nr:TrbG/VirB9 family P-type conjugative transfer protein [Rickettsiaceae bacterium]